MGNHPPEPDPTYLQLRARILHLDPAVMGLSPSSTIPKVWGVLMETGYAVGTASLVSLVDGTTSLYYSTGGGFLGSPDYSPLAQASKALVMEAQKAYPEMSQVEDVPLPSIGQVRFTCLTFAGWLSAEVPEKILAGGNHPLSRIYALGRETLSQLRVLSEKSHH
jgi:hypothetical protein